MVWRSGGPSKQETRLFLWSSWTKEAPKQWQSRGPDSKELITRHLNTLRIINWIEGSCGWLATWTGCVSDQKTNLKTEKDDRKNKIKASSSHCHVLQIFKASYDPLMFFSGYPCTKAFFKQTLELLWFLYIGFDFLFGFSQTNTKLTRIIKIILKVIFLNAHIHTAIVGQLRSV